jgi:hypothetical protein
MVPPCAATREPPVALMARVKTALRRVGGDAGGIIRGAVAFFRYFCADEDIDVGLGLLSAGSSLARRGKPNEYVVRIANAARQSRDVTLTIDIAAAHVSPPATGHYAYFTKFLTLQSRASRAITIEYDWINQASFHVGGASSPPDEFYSGGNDVPHLYALTAFLSHGQGRRLAGLTIYQELAE